MKRRFFVFFILLYAFISSAYGYRYENTIERSFPIIPDGTFKLSTVRGDVSVSTYEGNEIKIEVIFGAGNKEELQNAVLKFAVKSYSVIVTGSPQLDRSSLSVQYHLKIPEGLKSSSILTRMGTIKARGHYGDIRFQTAGAEITFRGSFKDSRFDSLNGDIDITVRGTLDGSLKAETANGSIWLSLLDDSSFDIEAATRTGIIRSDFALKTQKNFMGIKMTGTNGDGTYQIKLQAANGDITLRKR